jgi:hypothetical protein
MKVDNWYETCSLLKVEINIDIYLVSFFTANDTFRTNH